MKRSRHFLLVAFVATALAADRVAAAAPAARANVTQGVARRLAGRLVVTFRQVVPSIACRAYRQENVRTPATIEAPLDLKSARPIRHFQSSPFQYRLPPPQA